MKVHYAIKACSFGLFGTACGKLIGIVHGTVKRDKVTCLRCLAKLKKGNSMENPKRICNVCKQKSVPNMDWFTIEADQDFSIAPWRGINTEIEVCGSGCAALALFQWMGYQKKKRQQEIASLERSVGL